MFHRKRYSFVVFSS